MADEVIIEEYQVFEWNQQIPSKPTKTTVADIATAVTLLATTKYINIQAREAAFWFIFGASATAETDNNMFLPADQNRFFKVNGGEVIDTAANA